MQKKSQRLTSSTATVKLANTERVSSLTKETPIKSPTPSPPSPHSHLVCGREWYRAFFSSKQKNYSTRPPPPPPSPLAWVNTHMGCGRSETPGVARFRRNIAAAAAASAAAAATTDLSGSLTGGGGGGVSLRLGLGLPILTDDRLGEPVPPREPHNLVLCKKE